jgi:hypothetical protein
MFGHIVHTPRMVNSSSTSTSSERVDLLSSPQALLLVVSLSSRRGKYGKLTGAAKENIKEIYR